MCARGQAKVSPLRRTSYFFVGLLLLPACLAVAYSTVCQLASSGDFRRTIVFFLIGFVSYLTFFLAFRKPLRPYLVGHELTHALWVVLCRGRVHEIRLSKGQGRIKATKRNTLIALAPYFFPLYTLILVLAYAVASLWIHFGGYDRLVFFALGFTWSFHLLLNIFVLHRGQEDLKISGGFFSLVIIFLFNLVVLGLIMVFLSNGLTFKGYLSRLTGDVLSFYTALARSLGIK
jgi:uncharacterized membrane protein (GlpM family)